MDVLKEVDELTKAIEAANKEYDVGPGLKVYELSDDYKHLMSEEVINTLPNIKQELIYYYNKLLGYDEDGITSNYIRSIADAKFMALTVTDDKVAQAAEMIIKELNKVAAEGNLISFLAPLGMIDLIGGKRAVFSFFHAPQGYKGDSDLYTDEGGTGKEL